MNNRLLEFGNESSLDRVNINIRWLKEWLVPRLHKQPFIFPYTTFWIVLSGTAVIELNRVEYTLRRGDLVSIPPNSTQSWKHAAGADSFHYLSLACEAKIGTVDLIRSYQFPPVASIPTENQLLQLVAEWRSLAKEYEEYLQAFREDEIKSLEKSYAGHHSSSPYPIFLLNTDQTIGHLRIRAKGILWIQLLFRILQSKLPDKPVSYDNRVFEVCGYVERRLDNPPTLEEMAEYVSLSKEHLRTLFQASFGISPMKYVRYVRLQRSRDLLLSTSYSMKEIAAMIGFMDQHHFSRAFQQAEGMSPLAYRRLQRQP